MDRNPSSTDSESSEELGNAVSALTSPQLRRWIARHLGWKENDGTWWHDEHGDGPPPDYPNDLNAMAAAVGTLSFAGRHAYAIVLANMFWPYGWTSWSNTLQVSEAPARRRAEAFVIALREPSPQSSLSTKGEA